MRIVVCDDHRLLLEALGASLAARGHDVVALAVTPDEAVAAVTDHAPDVCLLDLHFPGGTSLDALQAMRAGQPGTKVVVFSATADPQAAAGTLSLWALRFLSDREWDVLRCITQGLTTRQIAGQLGVRNSTARTHVQNLLSKLGVHSRLEVAALLADHGSPAIWPARLRS